VTDATALVGLLRQRGETVGCAESLTGGLVCATLVAVPGASQVVRGAIVAYAPDLKTSLLGVDGQLLATSGTVAAATAEAMARGAAERLVPRTGSRPPGVAGPDPSEGKPAGTVHVAVAGPGGVQARLMRLQGDRQTVRRSSVTAVLELLTDLLGDPTGDR
jgi:nicotinamide-nucleotide amidase